MQVRLACPTAHFACFLLWRRQRTPASRAPQRSPSPCVLVRVCAPLLQSWLHCVPTPCSAFWAPRAVPPDHHLYSSRSSRRVGLPAAVQQAVPAPGVPAGLSRCGKQSWSGAVANAACQRQLPLNNDSRVPQSCLIPCSSLFFCPVFIFSQHSFIIESAATLFHSNPRRLPDHFSLTLEHQPPKPNTTFPGVILNV